MIYIVIEGIQIKAMDIGNHSRNKKKHLSPFQDAAEEDTTTVLAYCRNWYTVTYSEYLI